MPSLRAHHIRRLASASLVAAAVVTCSSCTSPAKSEAAHYCAIMPDSVGLYVDNPVTHLGFPIGKVAAVTASAQSVRVDFTVDDGRKIPADVKAVTRSTSILADRALELVGDYQQPQKLSPDSCIPLGRSLTPKSLSEVIGSSTNFINSINPAGSDNVGQVVTGIDQALRGQGAGANKLLTTASSVVDAPDQAIGDLGSVTRNLRQLTTTLVQVEPTLHGVFDDLANSAGEDAAETLEGASKTMEGIIPVIEAAGAIEKELGPQIQQLLDAVSVFLRKASPRAPYYASLLNVAPRVLNGLINLANNHDFTLHYRPPLYRIRTPDGVAQCNIMNASVPGSCANVKGTPYAVDVALLQYVLTVAANK
ncbi:MlaD family protein [Mycolicibacterium sp. 120266]|uniref:MlaD family protein n=1 Tax=Mycolicibacterium sp. 120266 TaxID=3090601 RepID=UPI00299ECE0E|nr:MlaD family protein [Mycolicibacterium sp. 120266]MDX1875984.1 MlaD family protein [Mycolicibacterium sp. 120266]